jgi:hypothetical protein
MSLKTVAGTSIFQRNEIGSLETLEQSLMPEGLDRT